MFEKEGITAELTIYRGGAETFEAMAAGAADIIVDPPSLVSAGRKKGVMSKIVANAAMGSTSVVLILGANDVVNPAAKEDPSSPIYGMPILEVEQAEHVIVNKRSMKPGYAGIENALFFRPKTSMLFGDAKKVLQELVTELKAM